MQKALVEGAMAIAKVTPVITLAAAEAPFVAGIAVGVALTAGIAYGAVWLIRQAR